ncbi:MAG: DUF6527 family protein [Ginsengibacter sp.]
MIKYLINKFNRLQGKYYYSEGEELPEKIKKKEVFISRTIENSWVIVMTCPCGCREKIYLNTLPIEQPCWKINQTMKGLTISPSIWRTKGCKSHFFVEKGKLIWA